MKLSIIKTGKGSLEACKTRIYSSVTVYCLYSCFNIWFLIPQGLKTLLTYVVGVGGIVTTEVGKYVGAFVGGGEGGDVGGLVGTGVASVGDGVGGLVGAGVASVGSGVGCLVGTGVDSVGD